ncbi:peptidoglycan-binding domain-containing protein [Methylobacterium gnaphalii]|uniref:Peptidoglycan binding-like domain-containing protein n=1 Tax=Methylobacterium gnaphalii TaxID=1010610 RepID=A0A512JLM4_9HYPH|nr:peptidoglycan-binding domain-containing protein [Methylobacterium gnaphalii]GEP10858.1 hypothetical protein MGN01_27030 [Methylobacterium gnaphalii]GJD70764.1 hypothetical protein MMMDOFMJ_3717 [Methylobacterium gnaphalii]GLS50696.1 hypothetical protein GCM10007885_35500 [Methylobacterium gnaphalii]
MREPSPQRDQREIIVPRDMRAGKAVAKAAPRRAARAQSSGSATAEFLATTAAFGRWIARTCITRPGEALGSMAALVAVGYVSVNALGRQSGPHPAPILPKAAIQQAKAAPAPPVTPPVAPVAAAAEPHAREKAPVRDAIGDILRTPSDTTASVTPKTVDKVVQAQRALAKLGYGTIKADGVMGPATKAAIEKFERDRKLPVTGEASGRTLRELAAKASAAKG